MPMIQISVPQWRKYAVHLSRQKIMRLLCVLGAQLNSNKRKRIYMRTMRMHTMSVLSPHLQFFFYILHLQTNKRISAMHLRCALKTIKSLIFFSTAIRYTYELLSTDDGEQCAPIRHIKFNSLLR